MISLALDTAIKIMATLRAMGAYCSDPDCGGRTRVISAKHSVCVRCGKACERRTKDEARRIARGET
jgi:hypothetical protein